jgi:agmatine/peptidylarginine deiminase
MHARPVRWALVAAIVASLIGLPTPEATHSADPANYAGIEDDDPNPLPAYASPEDRQLLDELLEARALQAQTLDALDALAGPPSGVLWTPAEYEEMAGVLVRWGSYNSLLTEFVVEVSQPDTNAKTWVLVENSSQQSSAYSTLEAYGAVMSNVEFITYDGDSVWIRDYGPRYTYEDSLRTIIDFTYNRPTRPKDNAFNEFLATLWNQPLYDMGLVRGGGNFHVVSTGEGFVSSLVLDPDEDGTDEYTAAEIKQTYLDYTNTDITIYERLPDNIDSTGHIDMWLMPLSDTDILVSEFAGGTGKTITDTGAADLQSRGYTVWRIPAWTSGGTHYTYTNAAIVNNKVFIPWYSGYSTQNAIALDVFQTAMPGYEIIQVDSSSVIRAAGAIHCVMKHVPAEIGVQISGYILDSAARPITGVSVAADNGGGSGTTDGSGYYEIYEPDGWSGTVTPTKLDYSFAPTDRSYSNITGDVADEDYTGTFEGDYLLVLGPDDFESDFGNYSNVSGDDFDWTRDSGGTPSTGTGPSVDHTTGTSSGFYLYTEASNPNNPNKMALLESSCITDFTGYSDAAVTFWYHMMGTQMGTLYVDVATNCTAPSWTNEFSVSGNQGDVWQQADVDLTGYVGGDIKLRFRGVTGSGWSSDIAIDDIEVTASLGSSCTVDSDCDDGDPCTDDVCGVSGSCEYSFNTAPCDDGVACTDGDTCDGAGFCQTGTPNDGLCDDGNVCTGVETCDPVLDCQAGTPLDPDDGVSCTDDSCDPVTGVANVPNHGLCANGLFCDGAETCDPVLDCQAGTAVDCSDGVGCTEDSCNETTDSCESAPNDALCDDGNVCTGVETCDAVLDCQPGTPLDPDDGVSCTDDSCDPVTGVANVPNHGLCDNGLFCDGAETCDAVLDCQAGTAVNCSDGVGCTEDSCNETTDSCESTANDSLCDNGLYCDGVESCDAVLDCQAGTPVDCSDGVGCTEDSCNETTDSCESAPNDALCDDANVCTGVETCDAVLDCQAGTPLDPDDGVSCTDDSCDPVTGVANVPNHGLCDNGLFCDGAETCDAVLDCQAGTAVNCSDGVGCTEDSCNETTDSCESTANDGLCDNGLYCDGAETCDAVLDCQAGTPVDCSDGVGCTVDSCNETTDSCESTANDSLCDDALYCNGVETCDAVLDCQAGTAVSCSDGIGCTEDSCNETTDSCESAPNDGLCDDGNVCTGVETCDAVLDCQAGTPLDPDDGVSCTDDSCDPVTGVANVPNDALCDDANVCSGAETCDAVLDCQPGTPLDPDDGVSCTDDSCDPVTGVANAPNHGLCDNGLFCDGAETCDAVLDCQAGTPVDCSDGVGCTEDSCNETTDSCESAPNDGLCDDGSVCTGAETCDAVLDCQAGTPLDPDDGVSCTDDSCDPVTGVANVPNDALCDDANVCTGVETCDAVLDCQPGTPLDPDDGVSCTDDSCDPATGVANVPNHGLCDNGLFCDGAETCDAVLDCRPGRRWTAPGRRTRATTARATRPPTPARQLPSQTTRPATTATPAWAICARAGSACLRRAETRSRSSPTACTTTRTGRTTSPAVPMGPSHSTTCVVWRRSGR